MCKKKDLHIAAVLVNYHTVPDVIRMAKVYESFECINYIVIINNDTKDEERKELKAAVSPKTEVLFSKKNLGYSRGNNGGIKWLLKKRERPDYIIISNSDIKIEEDAVKSVIDNMERLPQCGAMAPRMLNKDGNPTDLRIVPLGYKRLFLQFFVSKFDHKMRDQLHEDENGVIEQSFLPGSFFICRTEAIEKCNFFDPNVFLYREEEILAARLNRRGYKLCVDDRVSYLHDHDYNAESVEQVIRNHKRLFVSERYYFKRYMNASVFQMAYVMLFEYLGLLRYIIRIVVKGK